MQLLLIEHGPNSRWLAIRGTRGSLFPNTFVWARFAARVCNGNRGQRQRNSINLLAIFGKRRNTLKCRSFLRRLLPCFWFHCLYFLFSFVDYNCSQKKPKIYIAKCGDQRRTRIDLLVIKSCFTTPETRRYLVLDRSDRSCMMSIAAVWYVWRNFGPFFVLIEGCKLQKNDRGTLTQIKVTFFSVLVLLRRDEE